MTLYGEPEHSYNAAFNLETDACVLWPYAKNNKGYGVMRVDGKAATVHKKMCIRAHGPAPTPKHEAAHSCGNGNKACINKRHLSWKTKSENERDKIAHGTSNQGSRHGMSKLTEAEVRRIIALEGSDTAENIGALFGVGRRTVNRIHRRETWTHI